MSGPAAISIVLSVILPAPARGQMRGGDRFLVGVSAGVQPDSGSLSQSLTLTRNVEPAPVRARIPKATGPLFDAGVVARLFRGAGAGVSITVLNRTGDVSIDAEIPHPFVFGQPRAISGVEAGLRRSEVAVHAYAAYTLAAGRSLITLTAGPSFFRAAQDFVTDVRHIDEYPYDSAEYAGADVRRVRASRTGYNAGVDVTWLLSPRWGVGGVARFSRARTPFAMGATTFGTQDLGGVQAAAVVRAAF
jgi:hypothetical protein